MGLGELRVRPDGSGGDRARLQRELAGSAIKRANAVQITYQAGYGAAEDVPDAIKQAMYLLIGDMFENRLTEARPMFNTVDALLAPFSIRW